MQELSLKQTLTHRLTPQQIQLIKLLQVPSIDIKTRIEQEIAENPVLEASSSSEEASMSEDDLGEEPIWDDYWDELPHKQQSVQRDKTLQTQQAKREAAVTVEDTLHDQLLAQLDLLRLDKRQHKIGQHLIGSLESDGYIRRDLESIVNDLSFIAYIETDVQEVASMLKKIQDFDPPGIGARNLQECLLIQVHRKSDSPAKQLAIQILTKTFDSFTKKHYDKLVKKLGIEDEQLLKDALELIAKLNPKPGGRGEGILENQPLYPDFVVTKQNDYLQVSLSSYHTPELRIRKSYIDILEAYQKPQKKDKKLQEAALFIKQKIESAKWFIDAIKQRRQTLLNTMEAIVKLQHAFFMEEDEENLKPMILKDIAAEIDMDVSTVSRIVNNKSVQTNFNIYPLKFFFTEAISTDKGEEVSNRAVKQVLLSLTQQESKKQPYSDEKLTYLLKEKGYQLARRTVAKYREQLGIPVARLRKEV
jgi:RNA polymerase sigma-54 factor